MKATNTTSGAQCCFQIGNHKTRTMRFPGDLSLLRKSCGYFPFRNVHLFNARDPNFSLPGNPFLLCLLLIPPASCFLLPAASCLFSPLPSPSCILDKVANKTTRQESRKKSWCPWLMFPSGASRQRMAWRIRSTPSSSSSEPPRRTWVVDVRRLSKGLTRPRWGRCGATQPEQHLGRLWA